MWTSQWGTLIGKDLRLHGSAIALAMAGALALLAAGTQLAPQGIGPRVSLVFNVNILLTLLWSEWLVTRERSKRTFAWLRTLPVDDRVLAGSKFVTAAGCCVLFWSLSTSLFARELWQPTGVGVTLLCMVLSFGGLGIAARLRFSWRIGQLAPLCIVGLPVLLFIVFAGNGTTRRDALIALWTAPWGRTVVAASLFLVYCVIVLITVHWLTRAETVDLVD